MSFPSYYGVSEKSLTNRNLRDPFLGKYIRLPSNTKNLKLSPAPTVKGSISCYCTASGYNRKTLIEHFKVLLSQKSLPPSSHNYGSLFTVREKPIPERTENHTTSLASSVSSQSETAFKPLATDCTPLLISSTTSPFSSLPEQKTLDSELNQSTPTGPRPFLSSTNSNRKRKEKETVLEFPELICVKNFSTEIFGVCLSPCDQNYKNLPGEIFFFDYGVVVMWGLPREVEQRILKILKQFELSPLSDHECDSDTLEVIIDRDASPNIRNDVITLNSYKDFHLRVAVSSALSQSLKLSVYENVVDATVETFQNYPTELARTGHIELSRQGISKAIGYLFGIVSNVYLISNVLDTPELLWHVDDNTNDLYRTIRGYLKINKRIDVLEMRLGVLNDIISFLKDEQSHSQEFKLTWIVMILLAADLLVIGAETLLSSFLEG